MKLTPIFTTAFLVLFFISSIFLQPVIAATKYDLPYPGILPDHGLYSIKSARDKLWLFVTRDHIHKMELLLLMSDKHLAMARLLVDNDKDALGGENTLKAEQLASEMIDIMGTATKQGAAPKGDFVTQVKLSNKKHREIIEATLTTVPKNKQADLKKALMLNKKLKDRLAKL